MAKYSKAPIQEIICEFRFEPSQPWDIVYPGLVYEKLRDRFPKRKQVQNVAFKLDAEKNPAVTKTPRVQFLQNDEKVLIQVSENLLAVNHLPPYDNWSAFRPIIDDAVKTYVDIAHPKAIARIGLRYINHIRFGEPQIRLEEFFRVYPQSPDAFGAFLDFDLNLILEGATPSDALRCHFGSIPTEAGTGFILDFDHFTRGETAIPLDGFQNWLEAAHRKVDDIFEQVLTDKMKEQIR